MLKQLLRYKWYILLMFILIIIEPSINSVLNFWLRKLFNMAEPGVDRIVVMRVLTIGFLLWIFKRVVVYSASILKARFICNAKQDVKHNMFANLMNLDTSNLTDVASSGEYISLFINDINLLENRFYNQIVGLISGVFSIIIMGGSFFALNQKLALAIVGFGLISAFVPFVFSNMLNKKNLEYSNKVSDFTQGLKEYMVAYPTIKNYSIESVISDKFDSINQETENSKFEAEYSLALANNTGQLLAWFMQFIAVGFGIILVINGEISVGTVVASQAFASDLALPLQNIIFSFNSIRSVKEILKKIEEYSRNCRNKQNIKTSIHNNTNQKFDEKCDIRFEDIYLNIGTKDIINHFSFEFKTGKKYLIVGLNGSGKSSIFKALKKWFVGITGKIYINNIPVEDLDWNQVNKRISYLNENVSLFSTSVKENISLFRDKNPDDLTQAVRKAKVGLDLNRIICDEGRNISSGEQRRIEIARSLLESSKVLIFDEVVSTLDIETAYEIEKMALGFSDKTVIFISHNFSGKLIDSYDEILVMRDGTLVSHGAYKEMIKKCSYFKRICEIKFGIC